MKQPEYPAKAALTMPLPTATLQELWDLMHNQAHPTQLAGCINTGYPHQLQKQVTLLTASVISEAHAYRLQGNRYLNTLVSDTWKTVICLMDLVHQYSKANRSLTSIYKGIQCSLIKVHEQLGASFPHCCAGNSKIADIFLAEILKEMRRQYYKLLIDHPGIPLLKAILHPATRVVLHSSKGNNTPLIIQYADGLLKNLALWHRRKGTAQQLYEIALAMNLNSPHFFQYLTETAVAALKQCANAAGRQKQIQDWTLQHLKAYHNPTWRAAPSGGFIQPGDSLHNMIIQWLEGQKRIFELEAAIPEAVAVPDKTGINFDICTYSWHVKISVKAGFYMSPVVSEVLRVNWQITYFKTAGDPSLENLIKQSKSTSIPRDAKRKLLNYYLDSIKIIHSLPEKDK